MINFHDIKRKIIHEQNNLSVGYDYFAGIFSLCCKDVLMVDYDNKDGWSQGKVVGHLTKYTEEMHLKYNVDYLFRLFETDRGVHAFLINRLVPYNSESALSIMNALEGDTMYVEFVRVRGYCVRLNPKLKDKSFDEVKVIINTEFITRPLKIDIGYGKALPYIETILDFHLDMVNFFVDIYKSEEEEFIQQKYIPIIDSVGYLPSLKAFEHVKSQTIYLLKGNNLLLGSGVYISNNKPFVRNEIELYSQTTLRVGFDVDNGIWHLCTPDILMVDFDTNNKMLVINRLEWYVNLYPEYLFSIYESDNGVHAYIVNKNIHHLSVEADKVLRDLTPGNSQHIDFVKTNTHCIRIGPKLIDRSNAKRKTRFEIQNSLVEKKCLKHVCLLGSGEASPEILKMLSVKDNLVAFIKHLYINFYDKGMIIDIAADVKPEDYFINAIREETIGLLSINELKTKDYTDFKNLRMDSLLNAKRYSDLFDKNYRTKGMTAEDYLSRMSVAVVQKSKNPAITDKRLKDNLPLYSVDWLVNNAVNKMVADSQCSQTILLRGPTYPFVLGYDHRMKMVYIMFYDLLMIDWDVSEGIPKATAGTIMKRYIENQSMIPESQRVTKSELCFVVCESDNGTHGFCVSHRMPFSDMKSQLLGVHACGDYYYNAFSRVYGYSIRLSPKIINKDNTIKTRKEVSNQYIQRNYGHIGKRENIEGYLDSLVEMIKDIQTYIKSYPDLYDSLLYGEQEFLENVRSKTLELYQELESKPESKPKYITPDNVLWSRGIRSCNYTEIF